MLSGGERNRLLLARLFARPANVLVMDEPTNDLDIESLELLEQTLQDYSGTLLLVSHDRTFLDNVVTQVLAPLGDGRWREYVGGYSDWLRQRPEAKPSPQPSPARAGEGGFAGEAAKKVPVKMSYKETRELEQLPLQIEALEAEQRALARGDERTRVPQARRRADAQGRRSCDGNRAGAGGRIRAVGGTRREEERQRSRVSRPPGTGSARCQRGMVNAATTAAARGPCPSP